MELRHARVTVDLPVQYTKIGSAIVEVKVGGLRALFDELPESCRFEILKQIANSVSDEVIDEV